HTLSSADRNRMRGLQSRLPSDQAVARSMGNQPHKDTEIFIGKAVDGKKPGDITSLPNVFRGNCPLWVYILAEAMHHQHSVKIPVRENIMVKTPRLGPVGGRIVAEVFLGLMFGDKSSFLSLDPLWQPQ